MKLGYIFLLICLVLFWISCSKEDKGLMKSEIHTPGWVEDILSRTNNTNLLQGNWNISSVILYDNDDCNDENYNLNINGEITYYDLDAIISGIESYSFEDFSLWSKDDEYSNNDFEDDCIEKEGNLTEDGYCEFNFEYIFEYFLTEDGYCEEYTKDEYDKTIIYCGSISFNADEVSISFIWNSEKKTKEEDWDIKNELHHSGCKVLQLTKIE